MSTTDISFNETHYQEYSKSKNKNLFEEIIEKMMVESYMDETFQPYIEDIKKLIEQDLTPDKKRFAILCTLDKNRQLMAKAKCFNDENNKLSKFEHISNYIKILRDYVKVSEVEKKKFGEVMTPYELVVEMLSKLPKEVWSNPNLKWLDPCNGVGPFGAVVIKKLMKELVEWEPNDEKRYKHILENMVYVCELQPKNMFIWLTMIDPKNEFDPNIYCGSFLEEGFNTHCKDVWGVEKFDIVVGNPPYNAEQTATGKRGGGDTLWDKFVIQSINNLKESGYLCFVHPALWRKPQSEKSSSNEVSGLMLSKQLLYLEIHNMRDGMAVFGAGTRYDFYVLHNTDIYANTLVKGEDGVELNIDIRKYPFIPNMGFDKFEKLFLEGNEKCEIIFNVSNYETRKSWVSDIEDETHKYPLIHSTPKKGTRYMYSLRNDNGHFGIPKVIFGDSGIYDVIIDMEGRYGMTQHAMGIIVNNNEEADKISSCLLSSGFNRFLNETLMWSNYQLDWRLFNHLRKDFYNFI